MTISGPSRSTAFGSSTPRHPDRPAACPGGGAIEQLSWWGGRQRAVAARRLDYLTALRRAAEPIRPEAHAATLEAISNTINTVLDADPCRLVLDDRLPATVLQGDGSVTRAGRVLDVTQMGCRPMTSSTILVPRPDTRPGYFAVTAASHVARPRAEQRQVAALLAHLAAAPWRLKQEPRGPAGQRPRAGAKIGQD
jgi:hypothetical protein